MFEKRLILIGLILLLLTSTISAQQAEKVFVFGKQSIFYPHIISILKSKGDQTNPIYQVTDFNREFQVISLNEQFSLEPLKNARSKTILDPHFVSFLPSEEARKSDRYIRLAADIKFRLDSSKVEAFLQVRNHDKMVVINFQEDERFYQFTLYTQEIDASQVNEEGKKVNIIEENSKEDIFYIDKRKEDVLKELEFNIRKIYPALNQAPQLRLFGDGLEIKFEEDTTLLFQRDLYDSIVIDASQSIDLDGDQLKYTWQAERKGEKNTAVLLAQTNQSRLSLNLDKLGEVAYTLKVSDGIDEDSLQFGINTAINTNNYDTLKRYQLYDEIYLLNKSDPHQGLFSFDIRSPRGNKIDARILYDLMTIEQSKQAVKLDTLRNQRMALAVEQQFLKDSSDFYYARLFKKASKSAYWRNSLLQYRALDKYDNLIVDTSYIFINEKRIGFIKMLLNFRYLHIKEDRRNFKHTDYFYPSVGFALNMIRTKRLATSLEFTLPLSFLSLGWTLDSRDQKLIKGGLYGGIKVALIKKEQNSNLIVRSGDERVVGLGKEIVNVYPLVFFAGINQLRTIGLNYDIDIEDFIDVERSLTFLDLGIGSEFRIGEFSTLYVKTGALFSNQSKFTIKRSANITLGLNITIF